MTPTRQYLWVNHAGGSRVRSPFPLGEGALKPVAVARRAARGRTRPELSLHEPPDKDPKMRGGQRFQSPSLSAPHLWVFSLWFMVPMRGVRAVVAPHEPGVAGVRACRRAGRPARRGGREAFGCVPGQEWLPSGRQDAASTAGAAAGRRRVPRAVRPQAR